MKHNSRSKKHYNSKKTKTKRKTQKRKMKRGGGLFSSMSFGIPGLVQQVHVQINKFMKMVN